MSVPVCTLLLMLGLRCVQVFVSLTNCSSQPLSFEVSVQPCEQTNQNEFLYELQHKLLWTGSLAGTLVGVGLASASFAAAATAASLRHGRRRCRCKRARRACLNSISASYRSDASALNSLFATDAMAPLVPPAEVVATASCTHVRCLSSSNPS